MPVGIYWLSLFAVGAFASILHLLISYALKFAPSTTLAPLHYLEIVSALFFGYLIFSDIPNQTAIIGTNIIIGSELYVFYRERKLQKKIKIKINLISTYSRNMEQNRTLFGIGFMLLFCTLAPLGDTLAKILGQTVSLGPLIFIRFAKQVIILAPMALAIQGSWHFFGKFLILPAIRTELQITGIAIMVVALQYLPLADAVAIVFILPLLVILLG